MQSFDNAVFGSIGLNCVISELCYIRTILKRKFLKFRIFIKGTMLYYHIHTGQCKSTGGCYNELVVAYFGTGGGVKWWKR